MRDDYHEEQPTPEEAKEALDSIDTKGKGEKDIAQEAVRRAEHIVANCIRFKQPRTTQVSKYRDLYAGRVARKFRQPFNVVLPVFSGAMDTLMAAFNDDLALEFEGREPADYIAMQKLNALWQQETTSHTRNAKFPLKCRQDRSNAMFSGRGFMVNYATSQPRYKNCFEVLELEDIIFQPQGGGHLENHLFAGRTDIVRSLADLKAGSYNKEQVKKLEACIGKNDVFPQDENDKAALAKFQAMGLSAGAGDYVGEPLVKLVEIVLTIKGERWYLLFSPWYREWVRLDKNSVLISTDEFHIKSWATHEDNKNFLSKSYADDLYGVADAVHTLFNQELTNREKRNLGARGYDTSMVTDVAKLDAASTRPDALVPITVPAGKSVKDGIFLFDTPELRGTIDLIDWMNAETGKDVGVTDLTMGGSQKVSKKASVTFAEQQNVGQRLLLRSSSYTECMAEIGRLFFAGCKDHLPGRVALKRLGIEGEGWDAVIGRADLDLYGDFDVLIKSSSQEMQKSQLKKEARAKALADISADPVLAAQVNPAWRAEEYLRSIGEYDDAEVRIAMDTKNYGNRLEVARAHEAIQVVQHHGTPEPFYGATTLFMKIIHDFAVENRNTLGMKKYTALIDYEMSHADIVKENMARKAVQDAAMATAPAGAGGEPSPSPEMPTTPNKPPITPLMEDMAAQTT